MLDLGAGTGKLTRVLAARYAHVIAVEPLDGMRGILERVVPDVEALPGSAERIPLDDASVDAVFAAQAFHWFDHDRAIPEIARVLRPGGVLALVWNGPDESRPNPLPAEYLDYLDELRRERSFVRRDDPLARGDRARTVRRGARGGRAARPRARPGRSPRQRALGQLDRKPGSR